MTALAAHPNIIKLVSNGRSNYWKMNGKKKEVAFIVFELANGGELFTFIADTGRFSEPVARYYFKQLLEGLEYCHNNGVAHRDLKLENLLIDSQFKLKIADFGFSTQIEGHDGSGNLITKCGTPNYMAPEIHKKQAYSGASCDLFAAAIILFTMLS